MQVGVHSTGEQLQLALRTLDNPVFVVGTMRSGTGFLGLRLNELPQLVGCPFELRTLWSQVGQVPMGSDILPGACPALGSPDAARVPSDALRHAFALEVLKNRGEKSWSSGLRFLNKNPHLCNKIELVHALFPAAKIAWTLREMEAVVCSLMNLFARPDMRERGVRHTWPQPPASGAARCFHAHIESDASAPGDARTFPGGDITYLAQYWLESNLAMLEHFRQWGPEWVCPVPQPQLLRDPAAVATRLAAFLGLQPDALGDLGARIDRAGIAQWPARLSPAERARLADFRAAHRDQIAQIDALMATP